MATLKLAIDKRRIYNNGRYPIIFRLTSKTKSSSISTDISVFENEWDCLKGTVNKIHPNHKNINLQLKKRHYELERKMLEHTSLFGEADVVDLKNVLLGKSKKDITFYEFATREIQTLKDQQRFGNAFTEYNINGNNKFLGKSIMSLNGSTSEIAYTVYLIEVNPETFCLKTFIKERENNSTVIDRGELSGKFLKRFPKLSIAAN